MKHLTVSDVREHFIEELKAERFAVDKTGVKTIEFIGASFLADEPAIFGEPNQDYIDAEIDWYKSQSTNINDIYRDRKPPLAWQYTANMHGEINSNYGHLIYSNKYHNQQTKAVYDLYRNPDSRRAMMVYNRPSIWVEYRENGKNDFICTNAVTYYIRDGKLHCVVQMRSNDVVYGYKNDYAWQKFVLDEMVDRYNLICGKNDLGRHVEPGDIFWQVQNLHVYEKHFNLVK
jgi:thymidylate synthase